jgi:hypothetical protein
MCRYLVHTHDQCIRTSRRLRVSEVVNHNYQLRTAQYGILCCVSHAFSKHALQVLKLWMRVAVITRRNNQMRCTIAAFQLRRTRLVLAHVYGIWRYERFFVLFCQCYFVLHLKYHSRLELFTISRANDACRRMFAAVLQQWKFSIRCVSTINCKICWSQHDCYHLYLAHDN